MQTYYKSTTGVGLATLSRNNLATDVTDYLANQNITDVDGVRKSVTTSVPLAQRTVRNNTWSYGYNFCLGPVDAFDGALITYTYTRAGD